MEGYPPLTAAAECKDHLAAGIDTTGDALTFLMHAISLPENAYVQDKLREELRTKTTTTTDPQTLDQLPYLDAVIRESLRRFSPIPMSHPRYVPKGGRQIDGFFVPEGTIVSCQPYTLHLLDQKVFPEAEAWKPERWLDEEGVEDRNRIFFAFGAGARGCTGRK